MKTLTFGPAGTEARNEELFADLWTAWRIGETVAAKGSEKMRDAVHVFRALKSVSDPIVGGHSDARRLRDEGGAIELEDSRYNLLVEATKIVLEQGFTALTSANQLLARIMDAERAMRVLEFLDTAKVPTAAEVKAGQ